MLPTVDNAELEGLYVSEHYRTVESIRIMNIEENTMNLTPSND